MCCAPQRRALFGHANVNLKVFRTWGAFSFLSCKCASRHNGVRFFDISTSKRAPNVRCFELFHLQMCFVPQRLHFFDMSTSKSAPNAKCFELFHLQICFARQRRALFRQFNFQKWSEREVFWAVSLANVLRATTVCNFSFLIWPHGSAPAALASLLFDPPEPRIIGKTQWVATFLPFHAPASSLFWFFLFSDLLSSALLFSDSSHLFFSSIHTVGSLTSKLPSKTCRFIKAREEATFRATHIFQVSLHRRTIYHRMLHHKRQHHITPHYKSYITQQYITKQYIT